MENAAKKLNDQANTDRKVADEREEPERKKLLEGAAKMEKEAAKKQAFVDQHRDIAGLKLQVHSRT